MAMLDKEKINVSGRTSLDGTRLCHTTQNDRQLKLIPAYFWNFSLIFSNHS